MSTPPKGREKVGVVVLAAAFTGMLFIAHLTTSTAPPGPAPQPPLAPTAPLQRDRPVTVEVYLDRETGCEYLVGPGITPRRDVTGKQICRPPEGATGE